MAFILGKLAILALRPSNFLLLLAGLGGLGAWGGRALAKAALAMALAGLLLASLLPLGNWLMTPLENRFPHPAYPAGIDGAVVLGGGILPEITRARGQPAIGEPGERYLALLDLARRYPDAPIVFTGGIGSLDRNRPPETDTVRLLLEEQGLPGRVLLEGEARSTRENALDALALANPAPGSAWLLVTSAAHMPRAVGAFRAVGWHVLPWPVDYRTTGDYGLGGPMIQAAERLGELDQAAYEWLGLLYYRSLGWTGALFPAPGP